MARRINPKNPNARMAIGNKKVYSRKVKHKA